MDKKILVVDNDSNFVESIRYVLEKNNFKIQALECTSLLGDHMDFDEYDIVIVELEMPVLDGIDVCKEVRKKSNVPIIVVSENNDQLKTILALECGADDFVVKPVNVLELKARINTILRRCTYNNSVTTNHVSLKGDFVVNTLRKRVTTKVGDDLQLTSKEFDLFYVLSSSPGKVFTRDELMERVWGYEDFGMSRTVDVHIRKLRSKIEEKTREEYVMTKWGVGYYYKA